MATYTSPVRDVLNRINAVTPVLVEDFDGKGEWLRLKSATLSNAHLFSRIQQRWATIAGFIHTFTLINCHTSAHAGVWLHYLPTDVHRQDHAKGCFHLPEF